VVSFFYIMLLSLIVNYVSDVRMLNIKLLFNGDVFYSGLLMILAKSIANNDTNTLR